MMPGGSHRYDEGGSAEHLTAILGWVPTLGTLPHLQTFNAREIGLQARWKRYTPPLPVLLTLRPSNKTGGKASKGGEGLGR